MSGHPQLALLIGFLPRFFRIYPSAICTFLLQQAVPRDSFVSCARIAGYGSSIICFLTFSFGPSVSCVDDDDDNEAVAAEVH